MHGGRGRVLTPWKHEDLENKGLWYTRIQAATHHLKKRQLFQFEKWTKILWEDILVLQENDTILIYIGLEFFFNSTLFWFKTQTCLVIKILNIPINRDLYGLVWDLNWPNGHMCTYFRYGHRCILHCTLHKVTHANFQYGHRCTAHVLHIA